MMVARNERAVHVQQTKEIRIATGVAFHNYCQKKLVQTHFVQHESLMDYAGEA